MATQLHMITAVVQSKVGDEVIAAAINAGATGATYFDAEGTGIRQRLGPQARDIEASKRAVFIVTEQGRTDAVFAAVVKAGKLEDPGQGFACVQEVLKAVGFVAARR
jgi:nitrogen regulatory protein P-II 1